MPHPPCTRKFGSIPGTLCGLTVGVLAALMVATNPKGLFAAEGPFERPMGQQLQLQAPPPGATPLWREGFDNLFSPNSLSGTAKSLALLAVISIVPAILLMTTSFVRISVVLGLLRQSFGTQLVPSNQVITTLALFMTAVIMAPVWLQVYQQAIAPYAAAPAAIDGQTAYRAGIQPIRRFMSQQIELAGNSDDVWLFHDFLPPTGHEPETYDEVSLVALLPAYLISELKVAFLIGFQIYLPFLIIDLVVAGVTASMGMMTLSPAVISLPLKLSLFVLVDGWHLVVGMLLQSFAVAG
jgi:flagellar biosynthetic protein FliP